MKIIRLMLYVIILVALFFVPLQRVNIANLEPIQGIWMCFENDTIVVETDTADRGTGDTVKQAIENMKQNSSGIVYLDTADYLFVSEDAQEEIAAMKPFVNKTVKLCQWDGESGFDDAIKYAESHKKGLQIKRWSEGSKLPEIEPVK